MIIFRNQGEIDLRSIRTFGVNAKQSETPIGYFGTGLKYAIAICMREGLDMKIYTGGRWLKFSIADANIRDNSFKIITMNDEELAFTTELGKNWELWMAFRELYCNAIDESGYAEQSNHLGEIKENETIVVVTGDKMDKIWSKRFEYILNPNVRAQIEDENVHFFDRHALNETGTIFYRGIQVARTDRVAAFDYNLLGKIDLTENRTPLYAHQVDCYIKTGIMRSKDKEFIREIVLAPENSHEGTIDFSWNWGVRPGGGECDTFLDVVGEIREEFKDSEGNKTAIQLHAKFRKASVLPTESIKLTDVEQRQYDRAYAFCKDTLGLDLDSYKTVVAENLGRMQNLGRADMNRNIMYISRQCFKEGTKRVAAAFLEEYTHLRERVHDETLEQKWVYINHILSLGEQLQGEPL